jgi:hypothetical protein
MSELLNDEQWKVQESRPHPGHQTADTAKFPSSSFVFFYHVKRNIIFGLTQGDPCELIHGSEVFVLGLEYVCYMGICASDTNEAGNGKVRITCSRSLCGLFVCSRFFCLLLHGTLDLFGAFTSTDIHALARVCFIVLCILCRGKRNFSHLQITRAGDHERTDIPGHTCCQPQ